MLDRLLDLVAQLGSWAYLIIFIGVCLESAAFTGAVVPGETLVLLGGFLAHQGILDVRLLLALVIVGAIIGDSLGYELGRLLGRSWIGRLGGRFGLTEDHLNQVDAFFDRHGGKTVLLARFAAFFRYMVPFVAGASRFPYGRFLFYNVVGGVLWSVMLVTLGYLAGASWDIAHRWIGRAGATMAVLLVIAVVSVWLLRRQWR